MNKQPLRLHSQTKRAILLFIMARYGMVFGSDLPPPRRKVRQPEDLLDDLED